MHFQHLAFTCVCLCFFFFPHYSECNSNRDSVLSYTSVRSNSSYLGSDEMGSGKEPHKLVINVQSFVSGSDGGRDAHNISNVVAIMTRSNS